MKLNFYYGNIPAADVNCHPETPLKDAVQEALCGLKKSRQIDLAIEKIIVFMDRDSFYSRDFLEMGLACNQQTRKLSGRQTEPLSIENKVIYIVPRNHQLLEKIEPY